MVQRLLPENQEHPERRRPAFTPEKVLANLRRLRLRSGVRVRDIQDLTHHQRDGKLTVAEFRSLLREVGIKVDDALAQETFARVDRGGHHKISWAELWAAMAPTPSDVLKELRVAMHKKRMTVAEQIRPYDSNVDYVLTEGEFHRLLDGLGFQLDDAEVRHILHLIDLDGNRTISCKELEYALELRGSAPNERPTLSRERWKGDELVPPKGFTQTSPDLAMQVPEGAGEPSPARPDQTVSQPDPPAATRALNEILREFDPSPLLVNPSSSSSAQKTTRPRPTLEDVMSQLRNLRLVRGISLADLKSTCDAGGDVKLTKDDLLKILLRVGIQAHAALAERVFAFIDQNGNGKISWEELWAAARPSVDEVLQVLKAIKEQRGLSIERLLRQHDSSGDDKLAFSEFQKLLQSLSIDIDQETAAEVFKRLDRDGDRQLSLGALAGLDSRGGLWLPVIWPARLT
ncbi:unnamed protein product [Cladocopium goreaui]|uniref:Phosphatidylinositol 4-phosphate 5-kinase 2 n=1 Tax=Cladocopium goreaui TaxID=2562237 RepID=A0A9P1FFF9_9DINO|nr:unnamed protein product [Cladocopium goreaui]